MKTSAGTRFICETCGTQFAEAVAPPRTCPICEDDRQYVGWGGQRWTTHEALAARHTLRIEPEAGVTAIGLAPSFAIDQRALFVRTPELNVLWECLSIVTPEAVAALKAQGGVDAIAISHPHFYAAMTEWSEALGDPPVYLHAADREWVQCAPANVQYWTGDSLALSPALTLVHCGGHFAGSSVLHWANGPRPGGSLLSGDTLQVCQDRKHVSFMHSFPNLVPLGTRAVTGIRARLAGREFTDVLGYTWGRDILGDGRAAVDRSFDRHLAALDCVSTGRDGQPHGQRS